MAKFEINDEGMRKLMEQATSNVAEHLNRVIAQVAESHSGKPVDDIKAEIRQRATTTDFTLGDDPTLQAVAEAIHKGSPPPVYRG